MCLRTVWGHRLASLAREKEVALIRTPWNSFMNEVDRLNVHMLSALWTTTLMDATRSR